MTDIFISYKREERVAAQRFADSLSSAGYSVWWDLELVGGEDFSSVIRKKIDAAKCVIVLWSNQSVRSEYVQAEAEYARKLGKVLPVFIDDVRPIALPLMLQGLHTLDCSGWDGSRVSDLFSELTNHVNRKVGRTKQPVDVPDLAEIEELFGIAFSSLPVSESGSQTLTGKPASRSMSKSDASPPVGQSNGLSRSYLMFLIAAFLAFGTSLGLHVLFVAAQSEFWYAGVARHILIVAMSSFVLPIGALVLPSRIPRSLELSFYFSFSGTLINVFWIGYAVALFLGVASDPIWQDSLLFTGGILIVSAFLVATIVMYQEE